MHLENTSYHHLYVYLTFIYMITNDDSRCNYKALRRHAGTACCCVITMVMCIIMFNWHIIVTYIYISIYVHIYIYISIYVSIYLSNYLSISISTSIYISLYLSIYLSISIYLYINRYIYSYAYRYMYVHIYIYIYTYIYRNILLWLIMIYDHDGRSPLARRDDAGEVVAFHRKAQLMVEDLCGRFRLRYKINSHGWKVNLYSEMSSASPILRDSQDWRIS